MIQIRRILQLFWAMLSRTSYIEWKVRRLPKSEHAAFRAHRQVIGCRLLCRILGIRVRTEGEIPRDGGMLVVCNHFGVLDPLVLATTLPVGFVGKAEIRTWPFLGWVSKEHGLLFVERERRTAVARFTELIQRRLSSGINVLVFPEGTTSPDETILPFKTGAFAAVAGDSNRTILPMYLAVESVEGQPAVGEVRRRVVWSDPSLPFAKHVWSLIGLREVEMVVRFGEVIRVDGRDRKQLAQVAREAVEGIRNRIIDSAEAPQKGQGNQI